MRESHRLGAGDFPILERVDGDAEFGGGLGLAEPFALGSCWRVHLSSYPPHAPDGVDGRVSLIRLDR